jgi:hypothetical protein
VCGLLLILLGAWGGLIPFVGPYFHYAYTPDQSWRYTTGRLYLEVVPGAVVLLGGLIVLVTRSRAVGGMAAFLAGLGGAWFLVGTGVIATWGARLGNVTPGTPAATSTTKAFLEVLGFFTGLGVVIVFIAALALGRFSLSAARDAADAADYEIDQGGPAQFPASQPDRDPFPTSPGHYPSAPGPYPPAGQYPSATGQFPAAQPDRSAGTDPFPTTSGQFPTTSGQYPPPPEPRPPSTS